MEKSVCLKKESFWKRLIKDFRVNWILYVMIIPVVAYFIIFHYIPMYGVTLAFKDYKMKLGILESPWNGFAQFERFFGSYNFWTLLKNTLAISVYGILAGFPVPIALALCLNYLKNQKLKKAVQMVSYAPHFISTVVICSMISLFMTNDTAVFNLFRGFFGLDPVNFLSKPEWFKSIYVLSGVWQGAGWDAIIYIAALSGVDYQMHEAAIMDGATKIRRMWHIDLPAIKPTVMMLLILRIGRLMNVGFEKIYLLKNSLTDPAAATLSTYAYEVGMIRKDYSYSTAVGLFNNIVNITLLLIANKISKKVTEESLF